MFAKKVLSRVLLASILIGFLPLIIDGGSQDARADSLSFVSSPPTEGFVWYKYDYEIIPSNYSATLGLSYEFGVGTTWPQLGLFGWHLVGFPNQTSYGRTWIYLTLTDDTQTVYQNFTIDVVSLEVALEPEDHFDEIAKLSIALMFGFGMVYVGLKRSEMMLLAGPVWMIFGLAIFMTYHQAFMVMSVGLGIVLLVRGAYEVSR